MLFVTPRLKIILLGIVALLIAAFIFLRPQQNTLTDAEQLISSWELPRAELVLAELHKKQPSHLTIARLYGEVLLRRGELNRASEVFRFLERADSIDVASTLLNSGFVMFYRGELDSAEGKGRKAGMLADPSQQFHHLARVYNLLGLIQFNRAMYDSAWHFQTESLQFAHLAQSDNLEADALRQLGVLVWYRGNSDSALSSYYEPALKLYRKVGDLAGEATTLSNIGLIYNDRERITGLRYQLEAFRIRKQIGDQRGLADSYYFLTVAGITSKNHGFSYAYRMKSLELSARIGYAWGREVAARSLAEMVPGDLRMLRNVEVTGDSLFQLSGEGRLYFQWNQAGRYLDRREWHRGKETLAEVLRLCDSLGYVNGSQIALQQYGQACYQLGQYSEAEKTLARALLFSQDRSLRPDVSLSLNLARTYLRLGKSTKATMLLKSTVRLLDSDYIHQVSNPGSTFSREHVTGLVHKFRSDAYSLLVEATLGENTEEMFTMMERERRLPYWGKREGFNVADGNGHDATSMYVRLLEQYQNKPEQFEDKTLLDARIGELRQAGLAEERALLEVAKEVELPRIPTLSAVRGSLAENEALLEYFLMEETVIVMVSRRKSSRLMTLPVTPEELTTSVRVLAELIPRGKDNPADSLWRLPGSFLFKTLLEPLENGGHISRDDHLLISPHKILHLLPFHVLVDGVNSGIPALAVQKYVITVIPSASWLVETRKTRPAPLQSLLAAAPLGSDLPYSLEEVRQIPSHLFSKTRILPPNEATTSEIIRSLSQYDVVHLATHARMNSRYPVYSFIECADGRLELHELFNHAGPARLVVLSACETGVSRGLSGTEEASDDIVSFPLAFIQNGVPSVISSLWLVEDESTALFFREFYASVGGQGEHITLADALAIAQRRFLSGPEKRFNHPFYWAPFYLAGDNR